MARDEIIEVLDALMKLSVDLERQPGRPKHVQTIIQLMQELADQLLELRDEFEQAREEKKHGDH